MDNIIVDYVNGPLSFFVSTIFCSLATNCVSYHTCYIRRYVVLPLPWLLLSDRVLTQLLQHSTMTSDNTSTNTISSGTAHTLSLLLREDPLLIKFGLTSYDGGLSRANNNDETTANHDENAAHSYAAALLHDNSSSSTTISTSSSGGYRQRATEALAEVDRKLALVESLSLRLSREAPEEISGPLLRLHGFELESVNLASIGKAKEEGGDNHNNTHHLVTLAATRDKAERIQRQAQLLDNVAKRVESTIQRGVTRMELATTRLSRVLYLSATLKMILRLQFEARKVLHAESAMDLNNFLDLRDLTRAAASVATIEELLSHPSLTPPGKNGEAMGDGETIDVVEKIRPQAEAVAKSVRAAAAGLMNELQNHPTTSRTATSISRLGATLQVYFHLGELPDATWSAISSALAVTEKATSQLFHPTALKRMKEAAQAEAKALAEAECASRGKNSKDGEQTKKSAIDNTPRERKRQYDAIYDRLYHRKLREKRAAAATKWSTALSDAASCVWNLHRVLARRNDPVTRKNFLDAVGESAVPKEFHAAESKLLEVQNSNSGIKDSSTTIQKLNRANFSLFSMFWVQMSIALGGRIQRVLNHDNGSLESDVAALYPAVHSASLSLVTELYDIMQMGLSSSDTGDSSIMGMYSAVSSSGVMGGSAGLEDSVFFGGAMGGVTEFDETFSRADEAAGVGGGVYGADTWTHVNSNGFTDFDQGGTRAGSVSVSTSLTLAVFASSEWTTLQGLQDNRTFTGLSALQTAFLKECTNRLCAPLEYLFPEAVSVDENGIAIPCLPTLPSRYDLAKIDSNIREELSLADPRQGGGDFSIAAMLGEVVVVMIHKFCAMARRAVIEGGEEKMFDSRTGSVSESMAHKLSVAGVMVCILRLLICKTYDFQFIKQFFLSTVVTDTTELTGVVRQICTGYGVCQPLPPCAIYTARGSIAFLPCGTPASVERD